MNSLRGDTVDAIELSPERWGSMSDDVDPENPRPDGYYSGYSDHKWYYVPDELAETIILGPVGNGDPGDDWILLFTPEERNEDDREVVFVRLEPQALDELYAQTKNLSVAQRQAGHRAECELCGEMVDFDRAIPDGQGGPCHRRCWADAYGAPDWFTYVE